MRLFEFEAKALLKGYGIPIPSSKMARSVEEVSIERPSVLKAQIHDEPFFLKSGVPT